MNTSGLGGRPLKNDSEFWSNVDIKTEEECWYWKHTNSKAYPSFRGKPIHKIIFKLKYGHDLDRYNKEGHKQVIRHLCNNKKCANPLHIVPGTIRQNAADYRQIEGNKHLSKTDLLKVKELRSSGMTYLAISKLFNTTANTIRNAIIGKGTYNEVYYNRT
jgi:hypothetical protein